MEKRNTFLLACNPPSLFVEIKEICSALQSQRHCHSESGCTMPHRPFVKSCLLFSPTEWSPQCMTFLQNTVSIYKYKHSCSTEMASPWFNYRSCQSGYKNTAPDKACPHSLILHRPFHTLRCKDTLQQTVKSNPEMEAFCSPKHPGNFIVSSYRMPLTPQKWGLFSFDNCPWFSQAPGICTTMAAASCMNNISGMWLCSYLSQSFQFKVRLLQGAFI